MKNAYNTSAYGSFAYVYDIFMEKEIINRHTTMPPMTCAHNE